MTNIRDSYAITRGVAGQGTGRDVAPLELHAKAAAGGNTSPIAARPLREPLVYSRRFSTPPEPPENLPEAGKELWRSAVPWLVEVNVLQEIDLPAFTGMCVTYAQAQLARKVLDEQGYFSLGMSGQLVEHPAVRTWQVSEMLFLRHAAEFGLTTMARTRLGLMDSQRRSIERDIDWEVGPSTREAGE